MTWPTRSDTETVATIPELNARKSLSMPSLKITPLSGISDRIFIGVFAFVVPKTSDVLVATLGNGSRTAKSSEGESQDIGAGGRGGTAPPSPRATANEPVTMLLIHAVEPRPVETMIPLEDWTSRCDPMCSS